MHLYEYYLCICLCMFIITSSKSDRKCLKNNKKSLKSSFLNLISSLHGNVIFSSALKKVGNIRQDVYVLFQFFFPNFIFSNQIQFNLFSVFLYHISLPKAIASYVTYVLLKRRGLKFYM